MALKVLFVAACTLVWLYWLQVPNVAESFSSVTCRQFGRVERAVLYDFVTYSEQMDKWMSIVSFIASDHRPLGIGKTYKTVIDSSTILHFNVTDYIPYHHIALESRTDFLRPRLEFWFFSHRNRQPSSATGDKPPTERPSVPNEPQNTIIIDTRSSNNYSYNESFPIELAPDPESSSSSSSTKLPPQTGVHNGDGGRQHRHHHQHPCGGCCRCSACRQEAERQPEKRRKVMDDRCDGAGEPTANVISGNVEHHRSHHHHQRQLPAQDWLQPENGRSSLSLKFYFKHNSFLFQHTLGRLLRTMVERHFRRSLRHLELILNDMETLNRALYR
ncbi:uncharacterized protein LOC134214455 [Armigeres subalbatus]|uniref:uncharacterized protein LOC134214455 n=1 Tax=Armigeres subalbatus TaxID=124917 RepID=UPI002ED43FA9